MGHRDQQEICKGVSLTFFNNLLDPQTITRISMIYSLAGKISLAAFRGFLETVDRPILMT